MSAADGIVKTVLKELSTSEADSSGAEEVLRNARVSAEIASREKGKKISPMPTREYLLLAQLQYAMRLENASQPGYTRLLCTTITDEHPPCDRGIHDLQPIQIKDLRAETLHSDKYIVFRTISVPVRQAPLIVVAEDYSGDATMVTLYNINIDRGNDQKFIPVNTYFIIRAPLYKMSELGIYAVRVDHPSDFIRMPSTCPLVNRCAWSRPAYHARPVETDVDKLKEQGGRCFADHDYQGALDAYNKALEKISLDPTSDMWRKVFCNRAVTQLKMGRYEGVLSDTTFLLPAYPDARRPMFLRARAYYNLRSFESARKAWNTYLRFAPNEREGEKHMKMTMTRLDEEKYGNYNLKRMSTEASQSEFPRLDYADYIAAVEIQKSKLVRGQRGLFAKQDFKQGDLVLCEKAFQICYKDEILNHATVNTVRNRFSKGPESRLPSMVTQKLFDNPGSAPRFLRLYCHRKPIGADLVPPRKDGEPLIDAFTVSSIVESNAFKVEKPSRRLGGDGKSEKDTKKLGHDTGIWIQASYINHSCVANVSRSFVGDMMIIRARCAIKKGEEILHTYVPAFDSPEKKKKAFKTMGFACKCELCKMQNAISEAEIQRRRKALGQFEKFRQRALESEHEPTLANVHELRAIVKTILDTYGKREHCFQIIEAYEMLFGMNYHLKQYQDCVKDLKDLLKLITGTDIGDFDSFQPKLWFNDIITVMMQFTLVFKEMGDNERLEKCKKIARVLYGTQTGLGFDLSPFELILARYKGNPL